MTASDHDNIIRDAAKWALHYSDRPAAPLYHTPCFYFTLDCKGFPNSASIHFVSIADALHTRPEGILRRAKYLPHAPGTRAAVVAYAIGHDGELYSDALRPPAMLLVYAYKPGTRGEKGMFERRVVSRNGDQALIHADRVLPFDNARVPVIHAENRERAGSALTTIVTPPNSIH